MRPESPSDVTRAREWRAETGVTIQLVVLASGSLGSSPRDHGVNAASEVALFAVWSPNTHLAVSSSFTCILPAHACCFCGHVCSILPGSVTRDTAVCIALSSSSSSSSVYDLLRIDEVDQYFSPACLEQQQQQSLRLDAPSTKRMIVNTIVRTGSKS